MSLLKFDGDTLNFFPWYDAFVAGVDSQPIPPVQKFHYLLSSLTGSALAAIEGIAITNSNYPEAIDILRRRFGDVNNVKMSLYSQLDSLLVATNRTQDLHHTLEDVDRLCRQLHSLGENVKQPTLIMVMQRNLPVTCNKTEDLRHTLEGIDRICRQLYSSEKRPSTSSKR
jgi:hypothetical protein